MRKSGRTRKPADLVERRLSYSDLGATRLAERRWVDAPPGSRRHESTAYVGRGLDFWGRAAAAVLQWGVKTRSGFQVEADGPVAAGQRLWVGARFGPVTIFEPVDVVAVVDEPARAGFAYWTLDGHPVSARRPSWSIAMTRTGFG